MIPAMNSSPGNCTKFVEGVEKASYVPCLDLLEGANSASYYDLEPTKDYRTSGTLNEQVFTKHCLPNSHNEMECEESFDSAETYSFESLSKDLTGWKNSERMYSRARRQKSTTLQTNCTHVEGHVTTSFLAKYDLKRDTPGHSLVESSCSTPVSPARPSQRMATKRDACGHVVFNEDWGYIAGLDYKGRDNNDIREPKSIRK